MTKSIGLIGIGVMGSNIALNFSEKGTPVHVFNQSEDKESFNSLLIDFSEPIIKAGPFLAPSSPPETPIPIKSISFLAHRAPSLLLSR